MMDNRSSLQLSYMELISRYRSALMGFAALLIVFFHCWIPQIPLWPVLGGMEAELKSVAFVGVDIFFFLSGMGLTFAIRKHSLRRYCVLRVKRLVFPFWVMAVLYAITEGWSVSKTILNACCISFFTESIFALLWFVPGILLLYLLFPAYNRLMSRSKSPEVFTLCALFSWLIGSMLIADIAREDIWCMTNRLPGFLLGIYAGEAGREKRGAMTAWHWMLCVLSLVLGQMLRGAASKNLIQMIPQFFFVPMSLIAIPVCFLFSGLFAALEDCGGFIRRMTKAFVRFLSFMGKFTLELYCIHVWLYGIFFSAMEGRVSYLTINLVTIPVLVFAGWVFYRVHMLFWKAVSALGRIRL